MAKEDIKTPKTPSTIDDYSLIPRLNYTDPSVYHDGGTPHFKVPKMLQPTRSMQFEPDGIETLDAEYDQLRYDGSYAPIIKLNNLVIEEINIKQMTIKYEGFLAELSLTVLDTNGIIQFGDSPGMNASIDVVITPSIPNVYKNIHVQFEVTEYSVSGDLLFYKGRHKVINMQQRHDYGMIKYPGCPNVRGRTTSVGDTGDDTISCNPAPNPKPNTWEYLHEIAGRCGLGFATTDQCKEIEDRLPRLLRSQSYSDFIEEQIKFSGLDEDSIFDVWIDLYGYLTMVNLSWVLNNEITFRHLSLNVITGMRSQIDELPEQKAQVMHRTLTNYNKLNTTNNALIENNYEWITDNVFEQYIGNLERRTVFTPRGVRDGNNDLKDIEVQEVEPSIDGLHSEDYEKHTVSFYCEFNDYDTKLQQNVRTHYLDKQRAKRFKVQLTNANLGLHRGTLVNISIWDERPIQKATLVQGSDKFKEAQNTKANNPDTGLNNRDLMQDPDVQYPNLTLTGLYYIDGMEFEYNASKHDITQYLYLIKKGAMTTPYNKYGTPTVEVVYPKKSEAGSGEDNSGSQGKDI